MISYVLPTRDRHDRLASTLAAIGSLPEHDGEVVIADNASMSPVRAAEVLDNGVRVRSIRLGENLGAAARNVAVDHTDAGAEWVVMLDDDSHPIDLGFLDALAAAPADAHAIAAEILLPGGGREAGGLPEVFIGCGAAIRREAFVSLGGYDAAMGYYAEEYDLAARMMLAGGRIITDRRFRVMHHKVSQGRDFGAIIARLVRNNGWVVQRYAPDDDTRRGELHGVLTRYRSIACKERVIRAYDDGASALGRTIGEQPRRPMTREQWDRFTGYAQAAGSLRQEHAERPFETAALAASGKNGEVVRRVLEGLGVGIVDDAAAADVVVPAVLSPGPLLDAWDGLSAGAGVARAVSPWRGLTGERPAGMRSARAA